MNLRIALVLCGFSTAVLACNLAEPADQVAETEQPVVGFRNYGSPEIGLLTDSGSINTIGTFCTGTAVAPNVILTAGHCTELNFFWTIQEPLNVHRYTVRGRWRHSFFDIGMLWLTEPVPFTRPMEENGPVNQTVAVWGFGGNDCVAVDGGFNPNNGILVKRVGFFVTQADRFIRAPIICGGDSGGPIVDLNNGQIFGVTVASQGTQPGDTGVFSATNLPTVWGDLEFTTFIWQSISNSGG